MAIRPTQIPTFSRKAVLASALLLFCLNISVTRGADEATRDCRTQAAAIVAEMGAQAEQPISDEALSVAREAALRGCLANAGRTPGDDTPAVQQGPAAVAAPQPESLSGSGFWDPILGSGPKRSDGAKRLRRRGRY